MTRIGQKIFFRADDLFRRSDAIFRLITLLFPRGAAPKLKMDRCNRHKVSSRLQVPCKLTIVQCPSFNSTTVRRGTTLLTALNKYSCDMADVDEWHLSNVGNDGDFKPFVMLDQLHLFEHSFMLSSEISVFFPNHSFFENSFYSLILKVVPNLISKILYLEILYSFI